MSYDYTSIAIIFCTQYHGTLG